MKYSGQLVDTKQERWEKAKARWALFGNDPDLFPLPPPDPEVADSPAFEGPIHFVQDGVVTPVTWQELRHDHMHP